MFTILVRYTKPDLKRYYQLVIENLLEGVSNSKSVEKLDSKVRRVNSGLGLTKADNL